MSFEVGHSYKDKAGNNYILLSKDKEFGIFKFNNVEKRFRIIKYCGIEAVIQYGTVILKSEKIAPQIDEEFDIPKVKKIIKINNNNQRYIDVFKKHKFPTLSAK